MRNIAQDITERMEMLQKRADELKRKRVALDSELRLIDDKLQALRTVLDWEQEQAVKGTIDAARVPVTGRTAWLGVSLSDAIRKLLEEHPSWEFRELRNRLVHDGFDFKGRRPGNAINMALVAIRRKQSSGDEAEG